MISYQKDLDTFYDKINVDYATYIAGNLANLGSNEALGFRTAGSTAELAAGDFLYEEFISIGLQNVRKENISIDSWEFKQGELHYLNESYVPKKITLSAFASNCIHENKQFELVYAGKGTKQDYENLDVADKLVLIDLDQYIGCQIGVSAYQARQKGAYGVIVSCLDETRLLNKDALSYENFTAPADIPAFSLSVTDANILKELLEKNESHKIHVILNCHTKVTPDSVSYNIIGEIPGKNPDDIILVMAHYDGLFHNFHDGASGCGLLLSIARSLTRSHYVPNKTIIFIAHSAKEWGLTNSSFNWSIGGYQQIKINHPEWAEKAFIAINLEGFVACDDSEYHLIKTTYEYQQLIQSIEKTVNNCPYKEGCIVESPNTILSDDFPYSQSGVPTLISYRPDSDYLKTNYHTNHDVMKNHFSASAYLYCHKLYGTIIILFDQMKIKPLNFEALFEALENSLDYETYHSYKDLYFAIHDAKWNARNLYEFFHRNEFNDAEIRYINRQLHYLYLAIQESFVRLSWYGANIFPHVAHQENILQLREAVRLLKNEKIAEAITSLCKIDLNLYAYHYDRETYLFYVKQSLDQDERHLAWGNNLLLSNLNLYDMIEDLRMKNSWENVYSQIEQLNQLIKDEENRQSRVISEEINHLEHISDWMKSLYRRR